MPMLLSICQELPDSAVFFRGEDGGLVGLDRIRREASPARIHLDSVRIRRLVPSAVTFNRRKHGLVAEVHSGERSELVSRPMLLLRRR
jgi:hypothetical protein